MTCKKCGRPLPEGHKGKLCENCMGKRVAGLKNAGKAVLGVGLAVLAAFAANKNNSNES